MDSDSWLGIGLLLVSLALLSIGVIAEVGLALIRRGRLRHLISNDVSRAQALEDLIDDPERFLFALAFLRTLGLVGILLVALGVVAFGASWEVVVFIGVVSLILLLLLHVSLQTLVGRKPEQAALLLVPAMAALATILRPLTKPTPATPVEEELEDALEELQEEGREEERKMLRGIIRLEDTEVRDIMVPRIDIAAIEVKEPLTKVVDLILKKGFSRIPVYEETTDHITGVLYAKDLLGALKDGRESVDLKVLARPTLFVPESKKVDELLKEFQEKKVHMALVIDEYGGTAGLVTIEDLLEEIVGEIEDEYDVTEPQVERLNGSETMVDARMTLEELKDNLGLELEEGEFDTLGGFLTSQLGRIPVAGDQVEVDGMVFSVITMLGRRVKKVKIKILPDTMK